MLLVSFSLSSFCRHAAVHFFQQKSGQANFQLYPPDFHTYLFYIVSMTKEKCEVISRLNDTLRNVFNVSLHVLTVSLDKDECHSR